MPSTLWFELHICALFRLRRQHIPAGSTPHQADRSLVLRFATAMPSRRLSAGYIPAAVLLSGKRFLVCASYYRTIKPQKSILYCQGLLNSQGSMVGSTLRWFPGDSFVVLGWVVYWVAIRKQVIAKKELPGSLQLGTHKGKKEQLHPQKSKRFQATNQREKWA